MTHEEIGKCVMVVNAAYPNMKYGKEQLKEMVEAWEMMFADADGGLVAAALKSYIATDTSGFPPAIGQIFQQMQKLKASVKDESTSDLESWAMVRKAIGRGTYNSKEEYDKLPELVQKCVGSPQQLFIWATDENYNESVIQSQFLKCYRVEAQRKAEYDRLPTDIKNLIGANKANGTDGTWDREIADGRSGDKELLPGGG